MARPVHQGYADSQTSQQGNVQEKIAEIVVFDYRSIQGDDKDLVPELRHISQDFAEVGQSKHRSFILDPWFPTICSPARFTFITVH